MIKYLTLLTLCCLQFSSIFSPLQSQTLKDIELLEGYVYNKEDTILIGNGYSIELYSFTMSKYAESEMEESDANLDNETYLKSARKIRINSALSSSAIPKNILEKVQDYINYNLQLDEDNLIECEGLDVYNFSNDYIWNKLADSYSDDAKQNNILRHNVAYVYRKEGRDYALILFKKEGKVDAAFMNNVASHIKNEGLPENLFDNDDKSFDFLGERIPLTEGCLYSRREVRQGEKLEKTIFQDVTTSVCWDYYKNAEDVQEKIDKTIEQIQKMYESRLMSNLSDTILFRDSMLQAQRIIFQDTRSPERGYLPPSFTSNYFLNTKVEGKNVYLNVSFRSDTNVIELPKYVVDNFFKSLTSPLELTSIQDSIPISDTIYIAKKNRFPIWTFHHKNSRINGLSMGGLALLSDKNVTNNGVRIEAVGSGVFVPFVFVMGVSLRPGYILTRFFLPAEEFLDRSEEYKYTYEVLYRNRLNTTNGLQLSALGSILETNTVSNGLSISGLSNMTYKQNGISVVGLHNYAYKSNGLQVGGLVASSVLSNGFQVGLSTQSLKHNGVQIGAYNYAKETFKGVQFGGYNRSGAVNGIQIGIYNNAKFLRGIQIGLWNRNHKRSLPFFNWGK